MKKEKEIRVQSEQSAQPSSRWGKGISQRARLLFFFFLLKKNCDQLRCFKQAFRRNKTSLRNSFGTFFLLRFSSSFLLPCCLKERIFFVLLLRTCQFACSSTSAVQLVSLFNKKMIVHILCFLFFNFQLPFCV